MVRMGHWVEGGMGWSCERVMVGWLDGGLLTSVRVILSCLLAGGVVVLMLLGCATRCGGIVMTLK